MHGRTMGCPVNGKIEPVPNFLGEECPESDCYFETCVCTRVGSPPALRMNVYYCYCKYLELVTCSGAMRLNYHMYFTPSVQQGFV